MKLDCNKKILLTLIHHENPKMKQQWCNWVGEFCSVYRSYWSYRLSLYWLMQSILSIISIVSILAFSIAERCKLRWSIIQMTQQNLGWTFGVKGGDFSRLLAFTGICEYFTRSVWEINKIPFGLITSNSPQDKSFTLQTTRGVIFFPGKKGITIVICHLASEREIGWASGQTGSRRQGSAWNQRKVGKGGTV